MEKDEIIKSAYEAFRTFERPEHFTDFKHCEECAEHDETMRSCELHNLGPEEIGQPGWSPLSFLTENALGYVMPRLIEMAISLDTNRDGDSFIFDYLLCITPSSDYDRFTNYDENQVAAINQTLNYLRNELYSQVKEQCCESDLEEAIRIWNEKALNQAV